MLRVLLMTNLCTSALVFKTRDVSIDPGRIYWPETEWVDYPIQFSSNHAGETTTMGVYFSVSTPLSNGIIEIHFPSGFSLVSCPYYLSSSVLSIPYASISPTVSISLSLPSIQLPLSSGSYGPFGVYTR